MQLDSSRRIPTRSGEKASMVAALSELAAEVQKSRTVGAVLETAGRGVLRLGMRLSAFELREDQIVLRHHATARSRLEAIEQRIDRPIVGLRAPIAEIPLAREVVRSRRVLHRDDLDVFRSLLRRSTGVDPASLDGASESETAGICAGVLAPLVVRDEIWGLLGVVSPTLTHDDAAALALFATQVGSAIEVALSIEALERTNAALASSNANLARVQRDLVERERLATLGELATVVAHEVRNPLCVLIHSIGAMRDLVRAGAPTAKLHDAEAFMSMAAEEVGQLNAIVSDLLEFASPHPPALHVGSLVPVLEQVAVATALDGRVCVEVAADLPSVEFDASFMQRAIVNLVLNALQATTKNGMVKVHAYKERRRETTFLRVDVLDDGLGIPADVRAKIFDPFFSGSPSRGGLGLAVVKRIIDCHGGELAVESSATGTMSTVRLAAA